MIGIFSLELSNGKTLYFTESPNNLHYGGCDKCQNCRFFFQDINGNNTFGCGRNTKDCPMLFFRNKTLTKDEVKNIIEKELVQKRSCIMNNWDSNKNKCNKCCDCKMRSLKQKNN